MHQIKSAFLLALLTTKASCFVSNGRLSSRKASTVPSNQNSPVTPSSSTLFYTESNDETWYNSLEFECEESFESSSQENKYLTGNHLKELRADIQQMKQNLQLSLATDDLMRVVSLQKSIEEAEKKDPELVYKNALKRIAESNQYNSRKKYDILSKYNKVAREARANIARLNLDGLWVANFGHGSELVNVTYTGDTIIGHRLNQPDQLFFEADLSPPAANDVKDRNLKPINLNSSEASKWGVDKLERYSGQIRDTLTKSAPDTLSGDLLQGNIIMFDGYFSFLWVPTRQHVFFSRPKPDTVLSMMRDQISAEDEVENMRSHLSKCFDKNIDEAFMAPSIAPESEPFRRISTKHDLKLAKQETRIVYEDHLPLHEIPKVNEANPINPLGKSSQSFLDFHKWMTYIEKALNPNELEK